MSQVRMIDTKLIKLYLIIGLLSISSFLSMCHINAQAIEKHLIFPVPLEVKVNEGVLNIDKTTFIIVPENSNDNDGFLAGLIFNEFVDKYRQPLAILKPC